MRARRRELTALLGFVDLARGWTFATGAGVAMVVDRGGLLEGSTSPSAVRVSVTTGATSLIVSRSTRTGSGVRGATPGRTPGTRTPA